MIMKMISKILAICLLAISCTGPVSDIALECGFVSISGFYSRFENEFGITPSDYRKGTLSPKNNNSSTKTGVVPKIQRLFFSYGVIL